MKKIVYTAPDGSVRVIVPAPEMFNPKSKTRSLLPKLATASEDEILAWIVAKDVPAGVEYHFVEDSDLPSREFRNAWKIDGGKIGHDMDKCRAIWKDKMREARAPKLAALDLEYQRADEADDKAKKREVAARKQALRDVTADTRIVSAKTPEELKAVWPETLK